MNDIKEVKTQLQQVNEARAAANKKLGLKMLWLVAGALLFSFALVPIYNVLCSLTGLNGKTENKVAVNSLTIDKTRKVKVEFTTTVMPGLGWNFYPKQSEIELNPGKIETVIFIAKNTTSVSVSGQAVPSVSPGQASLYLKKIECFCFQKQTLKAGETKEMPLRFYVSPEIPKNMNDIALSYAFFASPK